MLVMEIEDAKKQRKWDIRFLQLARHVSTWSKDPSTCTGAVIVRPDKSVCTLGFNGFPQGMPDEPWMYEDRDEKYSRIIHCEINAKEFAREPVRGYTLYTWPFACCDRCAVQMIQAGVSRFVFPSIPEDKRERWGMSMARSVDYYVQCHRDWTEIPRPEVPLVGI